MKAAEDHRGTKQQPQRLALEFRNDVIALLGSDATGKWVDLEAARLDAPDFADGISRLCRTARKLTGKQTPGVELMLPSAQVLSFDAPAHVIAKHPLLRSGAVKASLAGRSPVPASDLSIDWAVNADGPSGISAAERSVVKEACVYARRWGFRPKQVTTRAGHPAFAKGPVFSASPAYLQKPALAGAGLTAAALLTILAVTLWPSADAVPVAAAPPALIAEGTSPSIEAAIETTKPELALSEPEFMVPELAILSIGNGPQDAAPYISLPEQPGSGPARQTDDIAEIGPLMRVAAAPPLTDGGGATSPVVALPSTPATFLASLRAEPAADLPSDPDTVQPRPDTPGAASLLLNPPGASDALTAPLTFAPDATTAPIPAMALAPPVPRPGSAEEPQASEPEVAEEPTEEPVIAADPATSPVAQPDDPLEADPREAPAVAEAEAEADDENIPGPGAVAQSAPPKGRPDHLDMTPSALALTTAPRPAYRPKSIKPRAPVIATSSGEIPKTVRAPSRGAPSGPGVANAATLRAAIQLDDMNLLGVFGSKTSRRALLRMPDGQIMRVSKGTVVDGWVVSRIDATSMRMTRGGTAQTLNVAR